MGDVMTTDETVLVKPVEVTVRGLKFAGDLYCGGEDHHEFHHDLVWASLTPLVNKKLEQRVKMAIRRGLREGFEYGDPGKGRVTLQFHFERTASDIVTADGERYTRFTAQCLRCHDRGWGLAPTPWLNELFRKALGITTKTRFKAVVPTTIEIGSRYTYKNPVPDKGGMAEMKILNYCTFHGLIFHREMAPHPDFVDDKE